MTISTLINGLLLFIGAVLVYEIVRYIVKSIIKFCLRLVEGNVENAINSIPEPVGIVLMASLMMTALIIFILSLNIFITCMERKHSVGFVIEQAVAGERSIFDRKKE